MNFIITLKATCEACGHVELFDLETAVSTRDAAPQGSLPARQAGKQFQTHRLLVPCSEHDISEPTQWKVEFA